MNLLKEGKKETEVHGMYFYESINAKQKKKAYCLLQSATDIVYS